MFATAVERQGHQSGQGKVWGGGGGPERYMLVRVLERQYWSRRLKKVAPLNILSRAPNVLSCYKGLLPSVRFRLIRGEYEDVVEVGGAPGGHSPGH